MTAWPYPKPFLSRLFFKKKKKKLKKLFLYEFDDVVDSFLIKLVNLRIC